MGDRLPSSAQNKRSTRPHNMDCTFLRRFHDQAPNSSQLIGFLTLSISGVMVFLLASLTVSTSILGLAIFSPLILVLSPIWVPICTLLFVTAASCLSICGFGVTLVAGTSWLYRYVKGFNPPGANRFDYARTRIYDTAIHVKDCAREYGGYLHSKVKDAAPGV